MNRVLLIGTALLKKMTPIENNVDDSILSPYIFKAQETHIHQVLGTDLYERIKDDLVCRSLTGNYRKLYDEYIVPATIEWTFYEVMPFIQIKLTNKSVGRGSADYFNEGDLNDLKYLRNSVRDLGEFYSTRTTNYLKQNSHLFKEYMTNTGLDKIIPNSSNYFSGVYLGGGRSKDCKWGLGDRWKDIN